MDANALEEIFSEFVPEFDHAVELIGQRCKDVYDEWRQRIQNAAVNSSEFETLIKAVPPAWQFGAVSLENFQERFRKIGEACAGRQVGLGSTLKSLYLLAETGIRHLETGKAESPSPQIAVRQLYGLAAASLADGFEKAWNLEKDRLAQRLEHAGRRQHQASAYVTNVYEQERRRLSHDLHDDIGHQLLLLKLYLELLSTDSKQGEIPQLAKRLDEALALVSSAIDSIRRLILDLGPAIFDELGFIPALRFYARQFSSRTAVSVTVRASDLPEDLPASHQVALYRVLQGALSNVVEHARAGRVKVSIDVTEGKKLIMVVEDNGVGFDVASVSGRSFGLTAMRERVEVLGGRLQIESTTAGPRSRKTGTRISVELPLPEASAG